jgi:hypothetical protein
MGSLKISIDLASKFMERISTFSQKSSFIDFETISLEKSGSLEYREENREELIELAGNLMKEKQLASVESQRLTKGLVDHLQTQGAILRKLSENEENSAKEKYHEVLKRFSVVNQQNKKLIKEVEGVVSEIFKYKNGLSAEVQQLEKGLQFEVVIS